MPVNIRGKEYHTVAERVKKCHDYHPNRVSITTDVVEFWREEGKANEVMIKATITIRDKESGKIETFTDYAHEREDLTNKKSVNATSYLENASTSAIGRALAAAGFGGTEYASADEVANALTQGDVKVERELREKLGATETDLQAAKNQINYLNERLAKATSTYRTMQTHIEKLESQLEEGDKNGTDMA